MKTLETSYYLPPKTFKHTQKALVYCYHGKEQETIAGRLFTFPDYPGVNFFVFRDNRKIWKVRESFTGIKAGTEYGEKTQAGAIRKQWDAIEAMRNSKNGAGRHSYVLELFARCIQDHFARINLQNDSKAA